MWSWYTAGSSIVFEETHVISDSLEEDLGLHLSKFIIWNSSTITNLYGFYIEYTAIMYLFCRSDLHFLRYFFKSSLITESPENKNVILLYEVIIFLCFSDLPFYFVCWFPRPPVYVCVYVCVCVCIVSVHRMCAFHWNTPFPCRQMANKIRRAGRLSGWRAHPSDGDRQSLHLPSKCIWEEWACCALG